MQARVNNPSVIKALTDAIDNGNEQNVRSILESNPKQIDFSHRSLPYDFYPLYNAVDAKNKAASPAIIRLLLLHGASRSIRKPGNRWVFEYAFCKMPDNELSKSIDTIEQRIEYQIVKALAEFENKITPEQDGFQFILLYATMYNLTNLAMLLLKNGNGCCVSNIEKTAGYDGDSKTSALHHAVQFKNTDLIRELLKYNADVNWQDIEGNTPLHLAASTDYAEGIDILMQKEPSTSTVTNNKNRNPLKEALSSSSWNAVRTFCKYPAKNKKDTNDKGFNFALLEAAYSATDDIAFAILAASKEPNLEFAYSNTKETALHLAVLSNKPLLAAVLAAQGARIDRYDGYKLKKLDDTTDDNEGDIRIVLSFYRLTNEYRYYICDTSKNSIEYKIVDRSERSMPLGDISSSTAVKESDTYLPLILAQIKKAYPAFEPKKINTPVDLANKTECKESKDTLLRALMSPKDYIAEYFLTDLLQYYSVEEEEKEPAQSKKLSAFSEQYYFFVDADTVASLINSNPEKYSIIINHACSELENYAIQKGQTILTNPLSNLAVLKPKPTGVLGLFSNQQSALWGCLNKARANTQAGKFILQTRKVNLLVSDWRDAVTESINSKSFTPEDIKEIRVKYDLLFSFLRDCKLEEKIFEKTERIGIETIIRLTSFLKSISSNGDQSKILGEDHQHLIIEEIRLIELKEKMNPSEVPQPTKQAPQPEPGKNSAQQEKACEYVIYEESWGNHAETAGSRNNGKFFVFLHQTEADFNRLEQAAAIEMHTRKPQ